MSAMTQRLMDLHQWKPGSEVLNRQVLAVSSKSFQDELEVWRRASPTAEEEEEEGLRLRPPNQGVSIIRFKLFT